MRTGDINTSSKSLNPYRGKNLTNIILTAFLLIMGIISLFPFIFMISSSFKPLANVFEYPLKIIPKPFIFSNYIDLFSSQYSFVRWYGNTLLMEITTILFKCLIVGTTAYAFARLRFKGRDVIFLILLSALMIPDDVTIIPRYVVYRYLHMTDSMWALVLPYTFDIFFVFMLRQFFITIPFSISESAIIDGCSHFKVFYKIILPLAKPAMVTMVIFTFVWAWNDYINPYIFITNPDKQMLSVGMQFFTLMQVTNYALQMAAATIVLIPVIIIFLAAQRYFIEGLVVGAVKG